MKQLPRGEVCKCHSSFKTRETKEEHHWLQLLSEENQGVNFKQKTEQEDMIFTFLKPPNNNHEFAAEVRFDLKSWISKEKELT